MLQFSNLRNGGWRCFLASNSCLKRPEMQRKIILKLYYHYIYHFGLCKTQCWKIPAFSSDLSLFILRVVRVSTCLIMMTNILSNMITRGPMLMRQNTASLATDNKLLFFTEILIVFSFSLVQFLHTQTQRVNWKRENYRRTLLWWDGAQSLKF